jgi:hypothetical protein
MKLRLKLLIIAMASLCACSDETGTSKKYISVDPVSYQEYAALEAKLEYKKVDGYTYDSSNLSGGQAAHNIHYVLNDLIDRLQYSEDSSAVADIERIAGDLMVTASNQGFDFVRQLVPFGFIGVEHSNGVPYAWGFHTFKALLPVIRYKRLIGQNTDDVAGILSSYESDWNGSMYVEPYLGRVSPFNMNAYMTLAWYELTGDASRMDSVGRILIANMRDYQGYQIWDYTIGGRVEDPQHAVASLLMVAKLYELGLFPKTTFEEMLTTWNGLGFAPDGTEYERFDRMERSTGHYGKMCRYALPALKHSRELFEKCKEMQ